MKIKSGNNKITPSAIKNNNEGALNERALIKYPILYKRPENPNGLPAFNNHL
jgi:hypothetical protein